MHINRCFTFCDFGFQLINLFLIIVDFLLILFYLITDHLKVNYFLMQLIHLNFQMLYLLTFHLQFYIQNLVFTYYLICLI